MCSRSPRALWILWIFLFTLMLPIALHAADGSGTATVAPNTATVGTTGNEFTFIREGDAVTSMRIDQPGESFTARRLP